MSLNYSRNQNLKLDWQKFNCDSIDTSNLKVNELTFDGTDANAGDVLTTDGAGNITLQPSAVPPPTLINSAKVGTDNGYLLITPAIGVLFPISQGQSIIQFNNGFTPTDSGLSLTVTEAGIYSVSMNIEINVQTGLGGYFKIYNDNSIDESSVVGATLDSNGSSLNLTSLYKFDVGVNNVNIVGKYFGALGETLGVANWNVACHFVSSTV